MRVETIPIEKVTVSTMNIRSDQEFGDEEDQEMIRNIESMGILQPIVVRPFGDMFDVVVGRRRFLGAKQSGATEIACVIKELSDEEAMDASLSENIFRKGVDPVTLGRWVKKRLELGDISLSTYGRMIGKSKSTLSEWMRMNDLTEEMQNQVRNGAVPFRYALKVARMDLSPADETTLAQEAETGGFEAFKAAVDRMSAGREKRGAPKGLLIIRINFGLESTEYEALQKLADSKGMDLSDYCHEVLAEHISVSKV